MKKTLSLLLVLAIVLSVSVTAFATDAANVGSTAETVNKDLPSHRLSTYTDVEDFQQSVCAESNAEAAIRISASSSQATISIDGCVDETDIELYFTGNLLPMMGNGYFDDSLILGEFKGIHNNYGIAHFKIEKGASPSHITDEKNTTKSYLVTIVIENISSGKLYIYETAISEDVFSAFLKCAKAYYSTLNISTGTAEKDAYNARVMNTYQMSKNWKSAKNKSLTPRAGGTLEIKSGYTYGGHKTASYSALSSFLTAINNNGSVDLSNNSVIRDVVTQTGWRRYNKLSEKYMYIMYGSLQPTGSIIVQMSLVSWSGATGTSLSSYLGVDNAAMFEYDPYTQTARLIYYGWGINLEECYVGVGNLGGTETFFLTELTTFSLQNGGNPYSKIFWSKVLPGGSTTYDILESLVKSSSYDSNSWGKSFPQDLQSQLRMDDEEGKLVKDVGTHTGNNYLCTPGNYLCVTASYSGAYSTHKTVFEFVCTNNL